MAEQLSIAGDLPPVAIAAQTPEPARRRLAKKAGIVAMVVAWGALIAGGLANLASYETSAGAQGSTPASWPSDSTLPRAPGTRTLVMFVHPKCPCTRASLGELNVIMGAVADRATAFVVFMRPRTVEAGWEKTESWDAAGHMPGTTRIVDIDGVEAKRFGTLTSGTLVVYGPDGRREFEGGITAARGHTGDNMGRDAVLALFRPGMAGEGSHDVYGCPLAASGSGDPNAGGDDR